MGERGTTRGNVGERETDVPRVDGFKNREHTPAQFMVGDNVGPGSRLRQRRCDRYGAIGAGNHLKSDATNGDRALGVR